MQTPILNTNTLLNEYLKQNTPSALSGRMNRDDNLDFDLNEFLVDDDIQISNENVDNLDLDNSTNTELLNNDINIVSQTPVLEDISTEGNNVKPLDETIQSHSSYMKYPLGKSLLTRLGAKIGTKGLGYMVPYAGWGMAAADVIDYFGYPIYDHLPGGVGDYLSFRDTTEGE